MILNEAQIAQYRQLTTDGYKGDLAFIENLLDTIEAMALVCKAAVEIKGTCYFSSPCSYTGHPPCKGCQFQEDLQTYQAALAAGGQA